jgi:hypothetical protein
LAESPSKEVEIMKKFLMALVVLAIASAPALAGPNAGGILMAHNTGMAWTSDPLPPTPVPTCEGANLEVPLSADPAVTENVIWKVYAAFPEGSTPRVKTCGWGIGYPSVGGGGIIIEHNDAQNLAVFYITSAGWPASGTQVGMSFTDGARTDRVNELWWFSGYGYVGTAGEPQIFSVIPNSAPGNQVFGDDAFPTNEDPITGYGSLGFGTTGAVVCPPPIPLPGACCFPNGDCVMLLATECAAAGGSFMGGECVPGLCVPTFTGACCVNYVCSIATPLDCAAAAGTYYGDNSVCVPTPCPPPTPTENKSWGQIKNNYR